MRFFEHDYTKKRLEILKVILSNAIQSTEAHIVEFFRFDGNQLILSDWQGEDCYYKESKRIKIYPLENSICGLVTLSGQAIRVNDTRLMPHVYQPVIDNKYEFLSELAIPIKSLIDNSVLGVINLEHRDSYAFSEDHEKEIIRIADQASVAISLHDLTSELDILREIDKIILGESASSKDVHQAIVELACGITNAECGELLVISHDRNFLEMAGSFNKELSVKIPIEESISGYALSSSEPVLIGDVKTNKRFIDRKDFFNECSPDIKSLLIVPLHIGETKHGVLKVESSQDHVFSTLHLKILRDMGRQASIAIQYTLDLEILANIDEDLLKASTPSKIYQVCFEACRLITKASQVQILVVDLEGRNLEVRASSGDDFGNLINIQECESGRLVEEDIQYIRIDDTKDLKEKAKFKQHLPIKTRSALMVPVKLGGKTITVFNIESDKANYFTDRHVNLLFNLASKTACALETIRALRKIIHDIKNRITNSRFFLEKYIESLEGAEESVKADFERLRNNLIPLYQVVQDIFPDRPRPEPVCLLKSIQDVSQILDPKIKTGFEIKSSKIIPPVCFDPVRLNRVFTHLLFNAQNASIGRSSPNVKVLLEYNNSKIVQVRIKDNGKGMSKEDAEKCFAIGRSPERGGLGLFICQEAILEAGGNIFIDMQRTKLNKGTEFVVEIPTTDGVIIARRSHKEKYANIPTQIHVITDDDNWAKMVSKSFSVERINTIIIDRNNFKDILNHTEFPEYIFVDLLDLKPKVSNEIIEWLYKKFPKSGYNDIYYKYRAFNMRLIGPEVVHAIFNDIDRE